MSLLLTGQCVKAQDYNSRKRLDKLLVLKGLSDSAFIRTAFRIADEYMSLDHYDSAQLWLNRIHEKVSYRQPSLFSYFLTSRQAEVYYYNNLQQLGQQEAQRAVSIAEALKDSILRTDAYNFTGLFYTNMGKISEAIPYFKKGILLSRQPPFPPGYMELSNPHHLYGNLSEAFEKSGAPDSAIFYARLSLLKARGINHERGMTSAALSLANTFLDKQQTDSAVFYFNEAKAISIRSLDFDLELCAYGGLAGSASLKKDKQAALLWLQQGFDLLNQHPQLNSFYALLFLDQAARLYKQYGFYPQLAQTLERKSAIQTLTHQKNNQQYRSVLMTGLKNETRILNLEIAKAQHGRILATTRLYLVVLAILLMIAGFIAYRYYALQKLKVAHLRNKISQDLHDEVGATLSGIALYSYIARQQQQQLAHEQVIQSLDIIDKNATDMVKKLSDIVWVVNPVHDSLEGLIQRLEEYTLEMAAAKGIRVITEKEEQVKQIRLSMEQRKNIYLILKEAVNNAVKYSHCRHITLSTGLQNGYLTFCVKDDGIGFDLQNSSKGNGLQNMQYRADELQASLEMKSLPDKGTTLTIVCKITQ